MKKEIIEFILSIEAIEFFIFLFALIIGIIIIIIKPIEVLVTIGILLIIILLCAGANYLFVKFQNYLRRIK